MYNINRYTDVSTLYDAIFSSRGYVQPTNAAIQQKTRLITQIKNKSWHIIGHNERSMTISLKDTLEKDCNMKVIYYIWQI